MEVRRDGDDLFDTNTLNSGPDTDNESVLVVASDWMMQIYFSKTKLNSIPTSTSTLEPLGYKAKIPAIDFESADDFRRVSEPSPFVCS